MRRPIDETSAAARQLLEAAREDKIDDPAVLARADIAAPGISEYGDEYTWRAVLVGGQQRAVLIDAALRVGAIDAARESPV